MALFDRRKKRGGPGKFVQIDESKIGKGSIIVVMLSRVSGFSVASRKIHANVSLRQ